MVGCSFSTQSPSACWTVSGSHRLLCSVGQSDVLVRGDEGQVSGRQCREACSSRSEGFRQEKVKGRAYESFFVFCFFSLRVKT